MCVNEEQTLYDRAIWFLTVVLIASMYIWASESYGVYILIGITAAILGIYLLQSNMKIYFELGPFHIIVTLFGLFCLVSSFWAWNRSEAVSKGITIFEILLCISVLYLYYQEQDDLWCLANAIRYAGFIVVIYSFYAYGIDTIRIILLESARLDTEFANVNTIGMFASIAVCITVYEFLFRRKNWISLILCIPCVIIVAATGSRKSLVMFVLGIILCLIFRYSGKNIFSAIFRTAIIILASFFLFRFLLSLDVFSSVMDRMEGLSAFITGSGQIDSSALKRSNYIQTGIEQFFKNPVIGIGIGSSGILLKQTYGDATYLHNNFVELLCCGGIVGFCIYYSMYAYICYKLIRTKLQDPMSKLCIILLIINLIMDYGAVSYYSKSTYIYFLLFFLQVRKTENFKRMEAEENSLEKTEVELYDGF